MSWLPTVRSLLRDLERTKTSSPSELQLQQLHVETHENDEQFGLGNIEPIADFISSEDCRAEKRGMEVMLRHSKSARFCSDFISAHMASWIADLLQQAADKLQITRNYKLRIENDTYSRGVYSEMTMSFPREAKRTILFLSIIIRERNRPESSISSAELYFMLAMAATHCTTLDAENINVRLLIVYSFWVQIVAVNTTRSYITSIVKGWKGIADKMEIHQTPWFNFLNADGQLRILLYSFDGIKLEPKKAAKVRVPLQGMKPNVQRKQTKRKLVNEGDSGSKRRKPC